MNQLTHLSATKLAALIRARELSPVEVVEAYLRRIETLNPELNAVVTLNSDALDDARGAEAAVTRGEQLGPLHGIPLTIKDTIETRGLRTTFGSRLRADYTPRRDAPAVALLKRAGAIILGKTNVSEFAMALTADNPVFGRTNNPHNLTLTPGGSSGGEAAAVSAGLSTAGLGSDLAGSVRMPAHCCGIVGLKPTNNRVPGGGHLPPLAGVFALGASLGPLARSVEDLALIHDALTAFDPSEKMFVPTASGPEWRRQNLEGVRVAWYTNDGTVPVTEETKRAVESAARALGEAGLVPEEVRPPGIPPGIGRGPALWFSLFARAATEFLSKMYDGREAEAGPVVRAMLESGSGSEDSSATEFNAAVAERESLRDSLIEWMSTTPLIVAPIGSTSAFKHETRRLEIEGLSVGTFRAFGYSQTFNVYGFPSVCVPAGRDADGMPIGVQIVGQPFAENAALSAARIVEEALGGWQPPPEV